MWLEGKIVADLTHGQLAMYMGFYQIGEKIYKPLFMNEQKFKSTGKDVTLDDCIYGISAFSIDGVPEIFDDFDKMKEAIKKAGKALVRTQRHKDVKGKRCLVMGDIYEITIVDDVVVFTNKGEG